MKLELTINKESLDYLAAALAKAMGTTRKAAVPTVKTEKNEPKIRGIKPQGKSYISAYKLRQIMKMTEGDIALCAHALGIRSCSKVLGLKTSSARYFITDAIKIMKYAQNNGWDIREEAFDMFLNDK